MGKQRYLLWVVCSLATLASCSRDDEMPADNAIRFDNRIGEPYVNGATRGAVTDDTNFAEFGVFAYYATTGNSYNASTSKPDYMYNVDVTRPAGAWTYAPLKFWPQGSVSFFAYSPYNTDTEVSVACTTGAPVVTYAVPDEVADHRDLLLSAPALDKTQRDSPVMLTFHHALACIDFKARVTGTLIAGESIKVTSIRIGNFQHKASCHHELASITPTFTNDATDKAYSLSVANALLNNLLLTTTDQQITSANGCPMLWPQEIDLTDKLTVTAEYISNGRTRTIVFEKDMQNFVTSSMVAGKRYIFTLLFNPFGSMELTCTVVDWYTKIINVPDFD